MSTAFRTRASTPLAQERRPTRLRAALFQGKVAAHQLWRAVRDVFSGPDLCTRVDGREYSRIAATSQTPLWTDERSAEATYQHGKVQNLILAVEVLDKTLVRAGETLSFWRQLGKSTKSRGFVEGRMLQQGCMIPAVGGGLCQLSNALYDCALQAGCEIVERHAHSRVVPGSAAAVGRDATVAWNYVDLRFRARQPMLIRAEVTNTHLTVSFCVCPGTPLATRPSAGLFTLPSTDSRAAASTCGTCSHPDCFRRE